MEKVKKLQQNLFRKMRALRECEMRLEDLQRRYAPIFDDDEEINNLLEQVRTVRQKTFEEFKASPGSENFDFSME